MRRITVGLLLLCSLSSLAAVVTPRTARALQLTWADGSKDLTVDSVAIYTLLVRPTPPAQLLPSQWRLIWTGTGIDSAIVFLNSPGPADAAPTCSVSGPMNANEQLSHQTTIEFCGPGDGVATPQAAFVVRIDPSFHARLAVVPVSSMTSEGVRNVASDAEVTVNAGSTLDYPAAIWSAVVISDSAGNKRVGVVGIGMDRVRSVTLQPSGAQSNRARRASLQTADTVTILSQTATALTLQLPAGASTDQALVLGTGDGTTKTAATMSAVPSYTTTTGTFTMRPPWPYRAKDFAFIYGNDGYFHIFYIREDQTAAIADSTQRDFGHAISTDLNNWTHLDPVIPTRPGKFDDLHVWAPTVIRDNGTYYLYYTGVKNVPFNWNWYQQLGVATSTDLINWQRYDAPVYNANMSAWAYSDSSQFDGCQFRDPFVMPDPSNPAGWVMCHVAEPTSARGQLIVGLASNSVGGLGRWTSVAPMWSTDNAHYQGWVESPMMFGTSGRWYLMYSWPGRAKNIQFEYANSFTTDSTAWSGHYALHDETGAGDPTNAWFAPEFLRVPRHDYLAAVRDFGDANDGVVISEVTFGTAPHFSLGAPSVAAAGTSAPPACLRLLCSGILRGPDKVLFRVDMPASGRATAEVYDVTGRQIAKLIDRSLQAGSSFVEWNGKDRDESNVPNGVYFARLRTGAAQATCRIVVLR